MRRLNDRRADGQLVRSSPILPMARAACWSVKPLNRSIHLASLRRLAFRCSSGQGSVVVEVVGSVLRQLATVTVEVEEVPTPPAAL